MRAAPTPGSLPEIAGAFLKLGFTCFGGPVAHLGYFREEFVRRRSWLADAAYGDLVALCQFLPGPTSSQVVFGLGMHRGGLPGALAASLCFTLPSAVVMILFGYGVVLAGSVHRAGWLHGLKLAAVAVVAQAVWGMGRSLCPDRPRLTLALLGAALLLLFPGTLVQIGVMIGGAMVGRWLYRPASEPAAAPTATPGIASADSAGLPSSPAGFGRAHAWAIAALGVFVSLLVLLPPLASATDWRALKVFDGFFRAGSLVFGGGHVLLPLLRAEVVPPGWVNDETFLAGYGAAQALPGPLFTFAGYLGTIMHGGNSAWIGGVWCLLAIFLPVWLLIGSALPFWHQLRARHSVQIALRGANAAVVGILLAAFYNPVWLGGVENGRDAATALIAFALLQLWRVPPWAVVLLCAAAGWL